MGECESLFSALRRLRYGGFQIGLIYVAWGRRDGLHLIGPRRHFHAFIWTRGHRRNPFYVSVRRCV
jgi:hypothetical protein